MAFQVLVMSGEGIGPEITAEAVRVLRAVAMRARLDLAFESFVVGVEAERRHGTPLPADVEAACMRAEERRNGAILFGATADEPIGILRKKFDLFANLRPIRMLPTLLAISPLRPERVEGTDILIVRELVSDVYYGERSEGIDARGAWASQAMYYHEHEVERIVAVAFAQAQGRRRKVTLVHKQVVIPGVFGLWLAAQRRARQAFPSVEVEALMIDNMAMQLVLRPRSFDVVLAPNLFGDILSDLGAGLVGSIGLMPSASLNANGFALYEPISGTAPDLARGRANPVGSILSAAMLLRHSLGRDDLAVAVEQAVESVLKDLRTEDVAEPGRRTVTTSELGEQIALSAAALVPAADSVAPRQRGDP